MYKDHVMLQLQHAPQHTHTQTLQTSSFIFLPECSGSVVAGSRPPLSLCCITGAQWNPPPFPSNPPPGPPPPLPRGSEAKVPLLQRREAGPWHGVSPRLHPPWALLSRHRLSPAHLHNKGDPSPSPLLTPHHPCGKEL